MINFTKDELYWIERTADFESSLLLKKFFDITTFDLTNKTEQEKEMLKKYGSELINAYVQLRLLRDKLQVERGGER